MNAAAPRWVDFHCHLDLFPEHRTIIRECNAEKVATLAVTTTPKAYPRNVEFAAGSPFVMVALGLHPQLVAERADELRLFEKYLDTTRFVGEIGLDAGPKFYSSFEDQQRVFSRILRACDERGGKILSIHSVRCVSKVLEQLEQHLREGRTWPVLHWFTGTRSEAKRAASMGCYFSINSEMLRSPKTKTLIQSLPIERLLTETDGPFVHVNKRPARPVDVRGSVEALADAKGMSEEAIASQLLANFNSITGAEDTDSHNWG